ncbi:hypothetical protein BP6252_07855 [Coleophoma cylindrospora]|uniref:Uncharacterized protein n=1 Tax=Coleophoma cylindrospora TaxID=1849047 RepID=A0A3D8RB81_9HELO|nr:hypothetical protein BP6252_07855 [Coleophoma cylindrospora]
MASTSTIQRDRKPTNERQAEAGLWLARTPPTLRTASPRNSDGRCSLTRPGSALNRKSGHILQLVVPCLLLRRNAARTKGSIHRITAAARLAAAGFLEVLRAALQDGGEVVVIPREGLGDLQCPRASFVDPQNAIPRTGCRSIGVFNISAANSFLWLGLPHAQAVPGRQHANFVQQRAVWPADDNAPCLWLLGARSPGWLAGPPIKGSCAS